MFKTKPNCVSNIDTFIRSICVYFTYLKRYNKSIKTQSYFIDFLWYKKSISFCVSFVISKIKRKRGKTKPKWKSQNQTKVKARVE